MCFWLRTAGVEGCVGEDAAPAYLSKKKEISLPTAVGIGMTASQNSARFGVETGAGG